MARYEYNTIPFHQSNGVTDAGAGKPVPVDRYRDKVVHVYGTFTATVDLEGSLDGNGWFKIKTGLVDTDVISIAYAVKLLRLNASAYTSGPTVIVAGQDFRAM